MKKTIYIETVKYSLDNDITTFNDAKIHLKSIGLEKESNTSYFRVWFFENFFINETTHTWMKNGIDLVLKNNVKQNNEDYNEKPVQLMDSAFMLYTNYMNNISTKKLSKIVLWCMISFSSIQIILATIFFFTSHTTFNVNLIDIIRMIL